MPPICFGLSVVPTNIVTVCHCLSAHLLHQSMPKSTRSPTPLLSQTQSFTDMCVYSHTRQTLLCWLVSSAALCGGLLKLMFVMTLSLTKLQHRAALETNQHSGLHHIVTTILQLLHSPSGQCSRLLETVGACAGLDLIEQTYRVVCSTSQAQPLQCMRLFKICEPATRRGRHCSVFSHL